MIIIIIIMMRNSCETHGSGTILNYCETWEGAEADSASSHGVWASSRAGDGGQ